MPTKEYTLENGLNVKVYKRKGNRNLRLTLTPTGQIRVSIPAWAPYRAGLEFVKSRMDWIAQQHIAPAKLKNGQAIGKAHHLEMVPRTSTDRVSTRLTDSTISVRYPDNLTEAAPQVQMAARKASVKALRQQAEKLLPQRIANLAQIHDFEYQSITIKQLKGRWGSCDSNKNIVLNLYLMQLSWDLIDYVLLHELTHTRILKHGPDFWHAMNSVLPETKALKIQLRKHHPVLDGLA